MIQGSEGTLLCECKPVLITCAPPKNQPRVGPECGLEYSDQASKCLYRSERCDNNNSLTEGQRFSFRGGVVSRQIKWVLELTHVKLGEGQHLNRLGVEIWVTCIVSPRICIKKYYRFRTKSQLQLNDFPVPVPLVFSSPVPGQCPLKPLIDFCERRETAEPDLSRINTACSPRDVCKPTGNKSVSWTQTNMLHLENSCF